MDQKDKILLYFKSSIDDLEIRFNASKNLKEFSRLIEEWENLIKKSDSLQRNLYNVKTPTHIEYETYIVPILIDNGLYEFEFVWDVSFASKSLIKQGTLIEFYIENIDIDPNAINIEKNYKRFKNPIIILKSKLSPKGYFVLNGNHRIYEAKKKGINTLQGFYVDNYTHLKWLLTDLMSNAYLMIEDILALNDFFKSNRKSWLRKKKLLKSLNIYNINN